CNVIPPYSIPTGGAVIFLDYQKAKLCGVLHILCISKHRCTKTFLKLVVPFLYTGVDASGLYPGSASG
ncbi:hypothetical protein LCGC14_2634440, partial [marine sediment metagenome]